MGARDQLAMATTSTSENVIDEYLSVDCGEYLNLIKLWQTEQICRQSYRVYNILNRGQKCVRWVMRRRAYRLPLVVNQLRFNCPRASPIY